MKLTSRTFDLNRATIQVLNLVGHIVTVKNRQYKVHSVEGSTYYAHQSEPETVTVDVDLPPSHWITDTDPIVLVIPMGTTVGETYPTETTLDQVRRGVCLVKQWV